MALSFDELKKKKSARSNQFVASKTARTWDGNENPRQARPSRRPRVNAAMNEDWMDLHAEPIFWIDVNSDSRWSMVMEKLSLLEERVQEKLCAPLRFVQTLVTPNGENSQSGAQK